MNKLDWKRTQRTAVEAGLAAAQIVAGSALGLVVAAATLAVTGLGPTVI